MEPDFELKAERMVDGTCRQVEHWAKSVLLQCLVAEGDVCCDLFVGNGLDVGKWMAGKPSHLTVVERSEEQLRLVQKRCLQKAYPRLPLCIQADPIMKAGVWGEDQVVKYGSAAKVAEREEAEEMASHVAAYDVVGCFRGMDQAFRYESTARRLLQDVASRLKAGGRLVGMMTDSSNLFTRAHKKNWKGSKVEGEGFSITMPKESAAESFLSHFCPQPFLLRPATPVTDMQEELFLVHCPSLIAMAASVGLEMVEMQGLAEFVEENCKQHEVAFKKLVAPGKKFSQRHLQHLSLFCVFVFRKRP